MKYSFSFSMFNLVLLTSTLSTYLHGPKRQVGDPPRLPKVESVLEIVLDEMCAERNKTLEPYRGIAAKLIHDYHLVKETNTFTFTEEELKSILIAMEYFSENYTYDMRSFIGIQYVKEDVGDLMNDLQNLLVK